MLPGLCFGLGYWANLQFILHRFRLGLVNMAPHLISQSFGTRRNH